MALVGQINFEQISSVEDVEVAVDNSVRLAIECIPDENCFFGVQGEYSFFYQIYQLICEKSALFGVYFARRLKMVYDIPLAIVSE